MIWRKTPLLGNVMQLKIWFFYPVKTSCFALVYVTDNPYGYYMLKSTSSTIFSPRWRHQMETFSALLALCARNSPVTGEFPSQWPVKRSFDVFFDLHLNKRLSKQSWGWLFETSSSPLWRHCNDCTAIMICGDLNRIMRNRYSRGLFTNEDRLCSIFHVQKQSTNMTSQRQ